MQPHDVSTILGQDREQIDDFIGYIAAGGGSYILKIFSDGILKKFRSRVNVKKVFFPKMDDVDRKKIVEVIKDIDQNIEKKDD